MKITNIRRSPPTKKGAYFTDIHFGRKNSSDEHNQDCLNFVKFMIDYIKKTNIDHIGFLGDWFESRSSISGKTLDWSFSAAELLNELNIPIFFIVGNHDLHNRNNRDIFNTRHFSEFNNFYIVNDYTIVNEKILFSPYLFEHEYADLVKIKNDYPSVEYLFGHLDMQGFVLTGEFNVSTHGLTKEELKNFKRVYSGHYHKRQTSGNISYIGNPFPMDYSDANDTERGFMVYDYETDTEEYINWKDCPTYTKLKVSEVLEDPKKFLKSGTRATFVVDIPLSFEEASAIKDTLSKQFNLRELNFTQTSETSDAIKESDELIDVSEDATIDEMIEQLLNNVSASEIDNELLITIYKGTKSAD